jgi:hypothetical protein
VQGQAIGLGIHGYGSQTQFAGRADDAHGDFTAVGYKKLVHGLTLPAIDVIYMRKMP